MLSPAFLHYGPFHLAINMYSLYFAGSLLEQVIGRWRFALLYFASGIAGSAGAIWLSPNSVDRRARRARSSACSAALLRARARAPHRDGRPGARV